VTPASPRPAPSAAASKTWPDDTIVYAGAGAVFGSQRWDLTGLRTAVNKPASAHLLDFTVGLPGQWSLLSRELCMCRIDVRAARQAGVVVQRPAHPLTSRSRVSQLRRVAAFAAQTGRNLPSSWAQPDADALLRWHAERTRSHRELFKTIELVEDLRRFAPLLTAGALEFQPWPGLTKEQVLTHVLGDGAPATPDGTLTPLLPLEAFIPLFLAARAYVEVFAADILCLHRRFLAQPPAPASAPAVEAVRAWAAHPETQIPVHTERSAAFAANKTLPGEPIWRVIARLTGTSPTTIRSGCRHIIQELIDEGRTCPGLGPVTARVERPDGSTGPWHGPFETLFDLNRERAMLRAAAYIVLVGLTGMRDSEAQDLRRDAVHDHYGTPALKTRRHKLRGGEPEPISWWACDLALDAYRVLEALSEHPDHVIAGITRSRRAGINARQAMHSFAAHINTSIASTGLAPIPGVRQLSPQVLRETAAYAMGRFTELGDLVTGYLFGHARAATTASYQRHQPADSWNTRLREGETDATTALLDTIGSLIDGGQPVTGAHARELRGTALQVRATIIADPAHARRIAQLHQTTWHHGDTVSCRFDPRPAVCHQLARQMGIPSPEPGPLHDLCAGAGCPNAHYTPLHLPGLHKRRRDTTQRLASAASGSAAAAQLAADLAEIDTVITQLEGHHQ
jgi:hypothetical protein